ncbi:MAG: hypothetical protein ACYC91_11630 [Solirubrobacteraceae bacterium]
MCRVGTELEALVALSPWARTIGRLRCLRGIDTLSALGLCAGIGDWDHPVTATAGCSDHSRWRRFRRGLLVAILTLAGWTSVPAARVGGCVARDSHDEPPSAGVEGLRRSAAERPCRPGGGQLVLVTNWVSHATSSTAVFATVVNTR